MNCLYASLWQHCTLLPWKRPAGSKRQHKGYNQPKRKLLSRNRDLLSPSLTLLCFPTSSSSICLPAVRCTEPPHTGSCRESFTKWYYNPVHQECFRFNYGGCYGNENRFDSKESCKRTCKGVTGGWARSQPLQKPTVSRGLFEALCTLANSNVTILYFCFQKRTYMQERRSLNGECLRARQVINLSPPPPPPPALKGNTTTFKKSYVLFLWYRTVQSIYSI